MKANGRKVFLDMKGMTKKRKKRCSGQIFVLLKEKKSEFVGGRGQKCFKLDLKSPTYICGAAERTACIYNGGESTS